VCFNCLGAANGQALARFDEGEHGPDGAHGGEVLGHDQFAVGQAAGAFERPDHARIGRHPAVKRDGASQLLALGDGAFEVPRQRHAQARHDIVVRRRDLLKVDHVGLGEDAAASGDSRGVLGLQRQLAELPLDAHAQPGRLLVQERSRPRGANGVHGEVLHMQFARDAVEGEQDELGVLASEFDHRSHVGLQADRCLGLGDDLVDEERAKQVRDQLARRARYAYPVEAGARRSREHVREHRLRSLDGPAVRADVVLFADGAARRHQDGVDAY